MRQEPSLSTDLSGVQGDLTDALARAETLGRWIEESLDDIGREIEDMKRALADGSPSGPSGLP